MTNSIPFSTFKKQIDDIINLHPAIKNNRYSNWFAKGEQDRDDAKDLIVQLSVFSNDLNVALIHKINNANSKEEMRGTKQILMNELGVIYKPKKADNYDPENVANFGSVDGGVFRFKAAHYEWLADAGEAVGLGFNEMGRTRLGNEASKEFSNIMIDSYKSEDKSVADGANYGLEHWASSGFWIELIDGFRKLEKKTGQRIPIAYFIYHGEIEPQHTAHTEDDLVEIFSKPNFNAKGFTYGVQKILDGLQIFWDGLYDTAKAKYNIN